MIYVYHNSHYRLAIGYQAPINGPYILGASDFRRPHYGVPAQRYRTIWWRPSRKVAFFHFEFWVCDRERYVFGLGYVRGWKCLIQLLHERGKP